MNAATDSLLIAPVGHSDTLWFCRVRKRRPAGTKLPAFVRFLNSSRALFITSLASWPVLVAVMAACVWIGSPYLEARLPSLVGGVGFACTVLSVVDCSKTFHSQRRRIFAASACWVAMGALSLGLFAWLS
jgi:hypothetical protein